MQYGRCIDAAGTAVILQVVASIILYRAVSTISMGDITISMGDITISMGDSTISMGDSTISMGDSTISMGDSTISMGDRTSSLSEQLGTVTHDATITPRSSVVTFRAVNDTKGQLVYVGDYIRTSGGFVYLRARRFFCWGLEQVEKSFL